MIYDFYGFWDPNGVHSYLAHTVFYLIINYCIRNMRYKTTHLIIANSYYTWFIFCFLLLRNIAQTMNHSKANNLVLHKQIIPSQICDILRFTRAIFRPLSVKQKISHAYPLKAVHSAALLRNCIIDLPFQSWPGPSSIIFGNNAPIHFLGC